jgi:peptidyl-prolyl isomerase E (cyclophilin E)
MDEESLKAAFIPFGDIRSIEIPFDPITERLKNYGLIQFDDPEDCPHAILNMNNSELFG